VSKPTWNRQFAQDTHSPSPEKFGPSGWV
jgi:hypothetical protein